MASSYNADDLPLTVTLSGGLVTQPQYDGASRLTTLTLSGHSGVSQPLSSTYGYGYSPLDWTTALTSTLNGITTTQGLTHDAAGRLSGWSNGANTQSWQYDGNGNLTLSLSNTVPTTYTYGNGVPNELSKLQTPGQYTRKYAYDQQGDTTAITTTGAYSAALQYDSQARLVGVSFKSGQVITMTYNAQGQRASYSMAQPGQPAWSAQFQYRGALLGQAVVISGSQTYTDTYLYDQSGSPLELLRQQNGTTSRYWYVLDGRGNVAALTDVTGNVVDRYAYDAWGVPTTVSETVPQRWRYAGYWYDSELGWYWISVRSYDPVLKRWLQPDPSQQEGLRTFVYADDDPSDVTDPSGFAPLTCKAGYHLQYYRGGRFCEQDSDAKPVDPCDVPVIGYFCARNTFERNLAYEERYGRVVLTVSIHATPVMLLLIAPTFNGENTASVTAYRVQGGSGYNNSSQYRLLADENGNLIISPESKGQLSITFDPAIAAKFLQLRGPGANVFRFEVNGSFADKLRRTAIKQVALEDWKKKNPGQPEPPQRLDAAKDQSTDQYGLPESMYEELVANAIPGTARYLDVGEEWELLASLVDEGDR